MLARDGIAGLICLGASLGLLALTRGLPQPALVPIGPGFYPRILLVIMVALSLMLLAAALLRTRRETLTRGERTSTAATSPSRSGRAPVVEPRRNYRLVAITFLVFGAYVGLLPELGYRIATLLFVAALQAVLAPPRGRRWIRVITVAGLTAFVTHLVFERYLSVLLPRGRWTAF